METLLVPRLYQAGAMQHAIKTNSIVRADTGTGKTLIAIMVIRHYTSLPATSGAPHSLVVFLVPTVALANQQATMIASQTSLRVTKFSGDMGIDYWQRSKWTAELERTDVVVCTAAVLLNVLNNAYWKMEDITLMIFDECHSALKKHPYAQIMNFHYHTLPPGAFPLPRVLGMTASPIWNPKNPLKAINDLERTLDSRIIEVLVKVDDINRFNSRPNETLIEYDPSTVSSEITLAVNILYGLGSFLTLNEKNWNDIDSTAQRLGYFASILFIIDTLQNLIDPRQGGGATPRRRYNADEIASIKAAITELVALSVIAVDQLSNQVKALLSILERYKDRSEFHAIVFVDRRKDARLLCEIVSRVDGLTGVGQLRPGWLVGHGMQTSPEGEEGVPRWGDGMAFKEQAKSVAAFRGGEINLLFSTSVAEEGMDIAACNCVVRFDPLKTITGYIQSRGRARSFESEYVVLAERGSVAADLYKQYVAEEPALKEMYGHRPTEEAEEPELDGLPTFRVPSTGALLNYQNAIPLVSEFCALLPSDPFSLNQRPTYTIEDLSSADRRVTLWRATLDLPMIASLPSQRTFVGKVYATKKAAKQSAAFDVCQALYNAGALDEHLLPVRVSRGAEAKDGDGKKVPTTNDTPDTPSIPTTSFDIYGNVWDDASSIWLHVVELEDRGQSYTVGLVAGSRLDAVAGTLYDSCPERKIAMRVSEGRLLPLAGADRRDRLQALQTLNTRCVQVTLNRRISLDSPFFALWTPVLADGSDVDWNQVSTAFAPAASSSLTSESVIVVLHRRVPHRLFTYHETRMDVTSHSTVLEVESRSKILSEKATAQHGKFPDYPAYIKHILDHPGISTTDPEPILDLLSLPSHPQNHLTQAVATLTYADHAPTIESFPLSMCTATTLPSSFWKTIRMSPSILRLIQNNIQAKAALIRFELPPIELDLFIEALTPPSAECGFDYQTLETLGDSMLKVATTVQIYLEYPSYDEGLLAITRQNSVDNRYLRSRSLESGFASFILAEQFRPTQWLPTPVARPVAPLDKGDKGRRALSDTIESTLGAAYLTGGIEMGIAAGDRLGLCFGGTEPWGERPSALKLAGTVSPTPVGLRSIEENLGYTFTNGTLLLQGLTHRSYGAAATTHCYEREEHLGDAILDFWATDRLLTLFPTSTPRNLTFLRALLVSNPALSYLAIRVLHAQRNILHSSPGLHALMNAAATESESFTWTKILVDLTWVWDPPKVLGDCFEAIIGAVFVDCGFRLEPVFEVLDRIYKEVMPLLKDVETRDPTSRLLMLAQAKHCTKIINKSTKNEETGMFDAVWTFHEVEIATFSTTSRNVARQLAAQAALAYFNAPNNVDAFVGGCMCVAGVAAAKAASAQSITTTSMVVDAPKPGLNEEGMQVDEEECSEEPNSTKRVRVY